MYNGISATSPTNIDQKPGIELREILAILTWSKVPLRALIYSFQTIPRTLNMDQNW